MKIGDKYILRKPLIGHEFDEDIDNGARPRGLQHLSETTIDNVQYLLDWGTLYDTGTAQHHLTMYKHYESNAIVFAAGSIYFAWALDDHHDSVTGIPPHEENYFDCRVLTDGYGPVPELQQAMLNLFADMKVTKPEGLDKSFKYEKYVGENVGKPKSWLIYYDGTKEGIKEENGYRCIRIEGGSKIENGNGIIAGIEIVVTNGYIDGKDWNGVKNEDKRWYAGIIDYDKIAEVNENIDEIKEWYWYFEAYIDVRMKEKLYVLTRATNDNGDIENTKYLLYVDVDLDKLKPCVEKEWIWRQRPVLNAKAVVEDSDKIEL